MKITKINIPKSESSGLEHIEMNRLGPIVLITGKNGSGKTRILNEIKSNLMRKPMEKDVKKAESELFQLETNLNINRENLNAQRKYSVGNESAEVAKNINELEAIVNKSDAKLSKARSVINWDFIETSETANDYDIVDFVPKNLQLEDSNNFSKNGMMKHADEINYVGISRLSEGTFAKIQVIQNRWFEATHQDSQLSMEIKKQAKEDYKKLEDLVKIFLDTSVGRNSDGDATLFGFPLGKTDLSEGQKVLLQFCMAIYSQGTKLEDLILVLDEPENYLHPSALIDVLDKIIKCNKNGQIWVATHSIPILAHFDPKYIWYVEDNKISYAGKIPERVLKGLLGDENEIARLQDFISLPAKLASSRYAFECLFEPGSVATGSNDPQTNQMRKILSKLSKDGKIRVLDYGAGKGRLISNIYDSFENEESALSEVLDYIAFDSFNQDKETCENAISQAYGSSDKRYFNDMQNLLSVYDKGFKVFDERDDGRLKAHYIPKKCLQRIDSDSRCDAIKDLSKHAQEKIKKIRNEERIYKNGKLHGFWVQQFANAQLNLAEFTTSQ